MRCNDEEFNMTNVLVPIELITKHYLSPYESAPWPITNITVNDVANIARWNSANRPPIIGSNAYYSKEKHLRRIRWLAENRWSDAIELDIGINVGDSWDLLDGHHRLAAAIYRGDFTILASLSGSESNAKHYFGNLGS